MITSAPGPVEDVPHQMEVVHRQPLDELAQLDEEVGGPVQVDDGVDDVLVVVPLVRLVLLVVGVDQLVDDVGVLRGHGLADLGAGVLGADQAAQVDEPVEGDAVPLPHIVALPLDLLQLLLGVVDEGGQLIPVGPGDGRPQQVVDLLPHHAGGGVEYVLKGLELAVDVGDEVLGGLGQVLDGPEVDDLGAGLLDGGVLLGQQLQVLQLLGGKFGGALHDGHSLEQIFCMPVLWHGFGKKKRGKAGKLEILWAASRIFC